MKKTNIYIHIAIFILVFISYDLLVKVYANISLTAMKSLAFGIAYASACLAISYLFPKKATKYIQIAIIFMVFLLAFINVIHFRFFNTFFTFSSLQAAGEFKDFSNEVLYVLDIKYLFLLVPLIGFIVYVQKFTYEIASKKKTLITLIVMMFMSYMAPFAFFDEHEDMTNDEYYLYDHLQNRVLSVQRFGLFAYTKQDILNTLFAKKQNKTTIEDIQAYFDSEKKTTNANVQTGVFEGKNLILIQAESLNPQAISQELTPTLYQLQQEGMYFDNYYAPLYNGSTSDTEFVTLTGQLPSLDYGTTFINFAENAYPNSLGNTFKKAGYSVQSFHANHASFYNRINMHPALGFDLFDTEKLNLETLASDPKLMETYLKHIPKQPFVSLLITVSGHSPYTDREDIKDIYNQLSQMPQFKGVDESVIAYYATQMEFDQSLKILIDGLKQQNLMKDTVIVIYGDHLPKLDINVFKETLGKDAKNSYELSKVPFLIYSEGMTPNLQTNLMASVDVWPTLANMFGFTKQNQYLFGSDYFSENASIVLFQNRSYLVEGCLQTSEKIADFCEITDTVKSKVDSYVMRSVEIWQGVLLYDFFGGN